MQHGVNETFNDFLTRYRSRLQHVFGAAESSLPESSPAEASPSNGSGQNGFSGNGSGKNAVAGVEAADSSMARMLLDNPHLNLPADALDEVLREAPLSVFIPAEYGGRGGDISEGLSMLEASSYESLALSLTMGINGALFLQPLTRYGNEALKTRVFDRFMNHGATGGLMITEPDFGSDALGMQTGYTKRADGVAISGTKHWGGLTGRADYWLLTARPRDESGKLGRGLGFFVWEKSFGGITVEEKYPSLGLPMIPYGRNRIDTVVPRANELKPHSSGLRMLLDTLHRSRLQFPGMAMGYLRRIVDEAMVHTKGRIVGGRSLFSYDKVQERLAVLQAYSTACSAMCLKTSRLADISTDCSSVALTANSIKSVVTDMMQSAAQSLLQLFGANGYRRDHIASRSLVDSRPFQIFEGTNDILYEQISDAVLKSMRKAKESNLYRFLSQFDGAQRSADYLRGVLDTHIDFSLPQRKLVTLGEALGRVFSMEMVFELRDNGFHSDLTANALSVLGEQVRTIFESYRHDISVTAVEAASEESSWLSCAQVHAHS